MTETRIHELDFCAEVAKAAAEIFSSQPASPFADARIEGFGSGPQSRQRKDLRFLDRNGRVALTGEVKLPGTVEGRSPYDGKLVRDAQAKADNADVQYFFTWNVNSFVLWDRYRQDVPLLERRVREWKTDRYFRHPDEVGRPDNLDYIKARFLPGLLSEVGEICAGRLTDWGMPPDDIFIRSLESHLSWPTDLTRAYLADQAQSDRAFDARLQEWMAAQNWNVVRGTPEPWAEALDRAARTLVYVLANRVIFYQALRARFPTLPELRLRGKTASETHSAMQRTFSYAVRRTGDYEPLFYPEEADAWAGPLVFAHCQAPEAWRGALRGVSGYDFSRISSDIVGRIFQRLISPEERHRWGQHFTGDDIVDLINAFCVQKADAAILDPACGSGSFLVRAYYRKRSLDPRKPHIELLSDLFGSDIAPYPAHLATLNLAAREIDDERNYPRIARRDFFDVTPAKAFCKLPDGTGLGTEEIALPALDAVVGNPPYVRQEKIGKAAKERMAHIVASRWPGTKLSGRSDVHCYFWPAAAHFLKEGGYFGFLTSSSWLDVEYGFPLQRWILENFRIIAICESEAEPWFEDARVKTCATILQRCANAQARVNSLVKFVQFKIPLAQIISEPAESSNRFAALDTMRRRIEEADDDFEDDALRVVVKRQRELWDEGVRAGQSVVHSQTQAPDDENEAQENPQEGQRDAFAGSDYVAGKWGRYVRAPDFYFAVMREFGSRFVPLGEIADIRRGITSGCDAFFMPHDVTRWALEAAPSDAEFRRRFGVAREAVSRGEIKIVRAGDGSEHPIEARYLKPEFHSLRDFQRSAVRARDCERAILLVNEPLSALGGTHVGRYLAYGETHTFESGKSNPVPVPKRSTCAARDPWYDLTGLVKSGVVFWPMAHHYRHVIPSNPESLVCNHRMFDVSPRQGVSGDVLAAVLNSTVVALWKTFYGRYTGTEGSLDTEVIDVRVLEIPDPREASPQIRARILRARILRAFKRVESRTIGRLVEEELMDCHSPERAEAIASGPLTLSDELRRKDRRALDDAVFELLGVGDAARRRDLVTRLHEETARHFRKIRVVEIQKQVQRARTGARRFTADDLASDAWDAAELSDCRPLAEWLYQEPEPKSAFTIPESGAPSLMPEADMYDRAVVYFGRGPKAVRVPCGSRAQAELLAKLAALGLRGSLYVPTSERACHESLARLDARLAEARAEFEALAQGRSGDEKTRDQVVELLMHWFVHGRRRPETAH